MVGDDRACGDEAERDLADIGARDDELEEESRADRREDRDDDGFERAKSALLKHQHEQHVTGGDEDADGQRNNEQQFQRDGRADHFGEIAGGDGDLAADP